LGDDVIKDEMSRAVSWYGRCEACTQNVSRKV
jgi:hypothetical protein